METFGKVDILVNNAGIGHMMKLVDSTAEDYRELMDTNVFSSFLFSKYAAMDMLKRKEGGIIFVSSVTGHIGHTDEAIYTMTKFAQRGLSQANDKELAGEGIKTCVVCPARPRRSSRSASAEHRSGSTPPTGRPRRMWPRGSCMPAWQATLSGKSE